MTVRTRRTLGCFIVAALAAGVSLAARQEVTLRYVWPKDEALRYRMTQQTTSTLSGMPGGMPDINLEQTTTQVIRTVAKDVAADGTATLEQVIESIQMTMNLPTGKVAYDSVKPVTATNPIEEMMGRVFGSMVNMPITLILSSSGVVQKVEGVTKLAEKVFANLPSNPQTDQLLGGMKATMSDEGMKATFSQAFTQLPQQALKPGDTWKGTYDMPNPALGKMSFGYASTLQAVENQVAKVQTKLTITQDASAPTAMPMGLTAKLGTASGEAEIAFDVAKGRTQKAVSRFVMPISMSGTAPDGTTMSMTNNAKTTVTIELVQ